MTLHTNWAHQVNEQHLPLESRGEQLMRISMGPMGFSWEWGGITYLLGHGNDISGMGM